MGNKGDHPERLRRLAEAVRRSWTAHHDVVATRNAAMLSANEAGLSLGDIAKATGLARGYVQEIVIEQAARRPAEQPTGGT